MPTKQHRRIGQVLPAVDLHPEPVVDEEVPEVLLTLHGRLVRTAQLPIAGALGQPAREPVAILAAPCIHTGARLVCLLLRLLLNRAGPLICRSHGSWIPTTRDRLRSS